MIIAVAALVVLIVSGWTFSWIGARYSKVDMKEEPSAWDGAPQKVLLHHSEENHDRHVRAYFPEALQVTRRWRVAKQKGHEIVRRHTARSLPHKVLAIPRPTTEASSVVAVATVPCKISSTGTTFRFTAKVSDDLG